MAEETEPLVPKTSRTWSFRILSAVFLAVVVIASVVAVSVQPHNVNSNTTELETEEWIRYGRRRSLCRNARRDYGRAAARDCLHSIPGLTFRPNFRSFSGYLKVGKDPVSGKFREIFYWFAEYDGPRKANAPVVFWMNGGPGCSGFDGLFSEHGPYLMFSGQRLKPNKYALNKLANVVYFEAPYGVGFSRVDKGTSMVVGDMPTAKDNARMIRSFLRKFKKFRNAPVYILSESYGGHYMPTLAAEIINTNLAGKKPRINFKGMAVGNPFVDFYGNLRGTIEAYIGHGLVELPLANKWKRKCDHSNLPSVWAECGPIYKAINKEVGHLDPYAMDFTFCPTDPLTSGQSHLAMKLRMKRRKTQILKESIAHIMRVEKKTGYVACADNYMTKYFNRKRVQRAIHAKPTTWQLCSDPVHKAWPQSSWFSRVQLLYARLARVEPIKILVYSGDDDSVCSTYATQLWLWKMRGLRVDRNAGPWKVWYLKDQLGGYQTRFLKKNGLPGLEFTTIHTAGHMVPQTQPKKAFHMYKVFLETPYGTPMKFGQGFAKGV